MAQVIPGYEQQRNIERTQFAVKREGEAAALGAANQTVINSMEKVRAELKANSDAIKASNSQTAFNFSVAQLEKDLLKDPEMNNEESYYEKIDKFKTDSLTEVDDAQIANKLSFDYDKTSMVLKAKVDATKYGMRLEFNKVQADVNRKALIDRRFNAATKAEQSDIDQEWFEYIDDQTSEGALDWAYGKKMMDSYWTGIIEQEIIRDPRQVIEDLKKKSGPYSHLDTETKTDMAGKASKQIELNLKIAEKGVKQAELNLEVIQQQNEAQFAANLGKISLTEMPLEMATENIIKMNDMRAAGLVRPWFADAYTRLLSSPDVFDALLDDDTTGAKYTSLNNYAEQIFNYNNPDLQIKALSDLMDQASKGETGINEVGTILAVAYDVGAVNPQSAEQKKRANVEAAKETALSMMPLIYTALHMFSDDTKYYNRRVGARMDKNRMTGTLFEGLATGTSLDEAIREAEKTEQIRLRTDRARYNVGHAVETPAGIQYIWGFYPNGEADVYPEMPSDAQLKVLRERYP